MTMIYTLDLVRAIIKLLKEYEQQKDLCATEFLESKGLEETPEVVAEHFFLFLKHKSFFSGVGDRICLEYGLKGVNEWPMKTLLFLVICVLNEKNYNEILKIFKAMRHTFGVKVVEFFLSEDNLVFIARMGCVYFDKEYVLENVIRPLVLKEKLIKKFHQELFYHFNRVRSFAPKKTTKPIHNLLAERKRISLPPKELPNEEVYRFKPNVVPKTTYTTGTKTLVKINESKDKNWEEALKLYQEAKKCPIRVAHIEKKVVEEPKPLKPPKFLKTVPKFGDVKVKKNTTTLLREAANLAKEKEVECKKLEDLLSGALDSSKFEAIEEEIRKKKEQENVQEIERKHLKGLLTFEEAVLAKKKLLQSNQERMEKFKEERVELIAGLLKWKFEQEEKMKQLVEKSQGIERAAKESEKKMQEEKHAQAKMVDFESKKLLRKAQEEREEELRTKIKIIQELHSLHQIKMIQFKEYDPTECVNLGLLCEMSMAELQERLKLLRIEMREELEEKKIAIMEEKKKKEEFIGNVKEFIEQSRMCKLKVVPSPPPKLVTTPEISTLRERLEEARKLRRGTVGICRFP